MNSATEKTEQSPFICCGQFGKTVGLKGAIRFFPYSGQGETIALVKELYLSPSKKLIVNSVQVRQDFIVISFRNFDSVEKVHSLVNQKASLKRIDLPLLASGQYYWFELIGLEVFHDSSYSLGKVEKLYTNGPQDVLCTTEGYQIPYVKPDIIKEVSLEKQHILVDFEPYFVEN